MRYIILFPLALCCALLFLGCTKTVALVNGQAVSQQELDKELERAGGKNMLDTLIGKKLVEQDAKTKHITVADQEVNKQFEEIKKNLTLLDQQSVTGDRLKSLRDDIRFNILLRKAIMSTVPESEIKSYYEKNKDILPEVELSVIVLGNPNQAKALDEDLHRGKEFASAAREFSLDPVSRDRGGYVGYLPKGNLAQLSPALAKAAFSIKPGEISPVIKTPKGYYILKVLNKHQSFDELRDDIEKQMASDRVKSYLDDLREKAKIDYKGEYAQHS